MAPRAFAARSAARTFGEIGDGLHRAAVRGHRDQVRGLQPVEAVLEHDVEPPRVDPPGRIPQTAKS